MVTQHWKKLLLECLDQTSNHMPVPQTDTGEPVAYTKARDQPIWKELGNKRTLGAAVKCERVFGMDTESAYLLGDRVATVY